MTKILIVDDHPMTRMGLENLVSQERKDAKIFMAETFHEIIDELLQNKMDLVILDLGIPGGKGIEMIQLLRRQQKGLRVLVCSGRDEFTCASECLNAGANGFISKRSPDEKVREAIVTVLSGKNYVSEAVKKKILNDFINNEVRSDNPIDSLTPREKEILDLLLEGKWTKEIGDMLRIQYSTVSTHKVRIFQKMNVENVLDLFRKVELYTGGTKVCL